MAKIVTEHITDDLRPEENLPAAETVAFALDGTSYEIDLTAEHAAALRTGLGPFIDAGREVRQTRSRKNGGRNRERAAEIRVWANSQGIEVNERGRIPATIVQKYDAAH